MTLEMPQIVGTVMPTFGPKNYSNHQEVTSGSIIPTFRESPRP